MGLWKSSASFSKNHRRAHDRRGVPGELPSRLIRLSRSGLTHPTIPALRAAAAARFFAWYEQGGAVRVGARVLILTGEMGRPS